MTHAQHTHEHYDDAAAMGAGMAAWLMGLIAAVILAFVIAAIIVLIAQPWDDDADTGTPNVPGIEEPAEDTGQ